MTDKPKRKRPTNNEIKFARDERRQSNEFALTLWQLLRNRQCCDKKFRREYPIPPYTADFCCVELKLIVEVDGKDHFTDNAVRRDKRRDEYLTGLGYYVLRIRGFDIMNDCPSVITAIKEAIKRLAVS